MKIYTKTGDRGQTGLFGGGRVSKDDLRVEAYGAVDELNATLGSARAAHLTSVNEATASRLQAELFTVGAVLATPAGTKAAGFVPQVNDEWVAEMERAIDHIDGIVPKLTNFVLPGGCATAAALHLARSVCRRAERRVVSLGARDQVPAAVVVYLNRLSDLLFMMARLENHVSGYAETAWTPPK
jgi:cob(I)alamin adenosyltransferase